MFWDIEGKTIDYIKKRKGEENIHHKQQPSLHFIAIGGIGMQALARYCHQQGWRVQGSDCEDSETLKTLRQEGIPCFVGHHKDYVHSFPLHGVVYSSSVKENNVEYEEAKKYNIPLLHRSHLLRYWVDFFQQNPQESLSFLDFFYDFLKGTPSEKYSPSEVLEKIEGQQKDSRLLISQPIVSQKFLEPSLSLVTGSHGKTTTTALLTHVLQNNQKNPLGFVGGKTKTVSFPLHPGCFVVEGDESDGSHTNFTTVQHLIITNLDGDHGDYYHYHQENFQESFHLLLSKAHDCFLCSQDKGLETLWKNFHQKKDYRISSISSDQYPKFFFYGLGEKTPWGTFHDLWAQPQEKKSHLKEGQFFNLYFLPRERALKSQDIDFSSFLCLPEVFLPLWGFHNILNALGVFGSAYYGSLLSPENIIKSFASFSGVERRMTLRGFFRNIPILDDYAHHPREICSLGQALHQRGFTASLGFFEPHRYTRLSQYFYEFLDSFHDFKGLVVLPLYGAHQQQQGPTSKEFFQAFQEKYPEKPCFLISSFEELHHLCNSFQEKDLWDVFVFMGAGHSSSYGQQLASVM